MSDEFANWSDLSKLWHAQSAAVAVGEIEQRVRSQRRHMLALAAAEAMGLALVFIGAVWIVVHVAFLSLSGISLVFFTVCGFLQYRMRREPAPCGGHDLLSALEASVARENWNLAQFGVGRAVSFLTLASLLMVGADQVRHLTATAQSRVWSLCAIALLVVTVLAWNLWLTWQARQRRSRLEGVALHLRVGPEFKAKESS